MSHFYPFLLLPLLNQWRISLQYHSPANTIPRAISFSVIRSCSLLSKGKRELPQIEMRHGQKLCCHLSKVRRFVAWIVFMGSLRLLTRLWLTLQNILICVYIYTYIYIYIYVYIYIYNIHIYIYTYNTYVYIYICINICINIYTLCIWICHVCIYIYIYTYYILYMYICI